MIIWGNSKIRRKSERNGQNPFSYFPIEVVINRYKQLLIDSSSFSFVFIFAHACACIGQHWLSSSIALNLFMVWRQGLCERKLTNLAPQGSICLCPQLVSPGIVGTHCHVLLRSWIWDIKFFFSCLHDSATSLLPNLLFKIISFVRL